MGSGGGWPIRRGRRRGSEGLWREGVSPSIAPARARLPQAAPCLRCEKQPWVNALVSMRLREDAPCSAMEGGTPSLQKVSEGRTPSISARTVSAGGTPFLWRRGRE